MSECKVASIDKGGGLRIKIIILSCMLLSSYFA